MERTRYIVEYLPRVRCEQEAAKHPEIQQQDGPSLWDFCEPEDFTETREHLTEAKALACAVTLLPLDEFGEVHCFRQELRGYGNARREWTTVGRAVLDASDTSGFAWESV